MHVVSLNLGRSQILLRRGRQLSSAINRRPTDRPVRLECGGFDGDQVSDQRVHGGPDKAACVFASEHYPYFAGLLDRELGPAAFGENLTVAGLLETDVRVGDVYRVGEALVQVSQPRGPCQKLAMKHDEPRLIAWVNRSGFTGFYVRVLEPGDVRAGDGIQLVERRHERMTIAHLTAQRLADPPDPIVLRAILDIPELAAAWRKVVLNRLGGQDEWDSE